MNVIIGTLEHMTYEGPERPILAHKTEEGVTLAALFNGEVIAVKLSKLDIITILKTVAESENQTSEVGCWLSNAAYKLENRK